MRSPEKWVPFNDPCGFVAYNHTTDRVYHLYTSEKYGLEGPHLLPKANKHEIDPWNRVLRTPGGSVHLTTTRKTCPSFLCEPGYCVVVDSENCF